ncbi:MAG: hypothetical protein H6828_13055 [Planctomycetes bacterium]|nr:hypothetical protein [Planctomycetota bacterium]
MRLSTTCAVLLATSAMTVATAQTGADACTTPDAIAGQGTFGFDQTLATTGIEGQTEAICLAFGSSAIDSDVWFAWTADATGTATVETCTLTAVDTKIAAYPGATCPTAGSSLDCNDDTCGLQSQIQFAVTNGTTYTLQVGTFPGATAGTGSMAISIATAPSNDDCAAPTAIAGQGTFPFSNGGATIGLEGQTEASCYFFGSSTVDHDVWYAWTSDFTGTAQVQTCLLTAVDTKLAAYAGSSCPTAGSSIVCNDDTCGLQSELQFPVTNGSTYMLQVGTFPGGTGGTGSFAIANYVPPVAPANDDCSTPDVIAGQGTFAYDSTLATTGLEGQTETICYAFGTSAVNKDVWYSWTADATGPATVSTCGNTTDTKIAAYPGTGCPVAGSSLACNDDSCGLQSEMIFNVVAGTTYTLQIGTFSAAATGGPSTFDISIAGPAEPGSAFCFCDGTGTAAPCGNNGAAGNGCANSANANGANLAGSGSAVVGSDTVVLSGSGLVPNQPGLYFQGENAINGGLGVVFGDGIRCAGQNVIRLGIRVADGSGNSSTTGITVSTAGGVTAGDLRHYQLWFRDPNGGAGGPCGNVFNLSNGYSIQW